MWKVLKSRDICHVLYSDNYESEQNNDEYFYNSIVHSFIFGSNINRILQIKVSYYILAFIIKVSFSSLWVVINNKYVFKD